MKVGITGGTGLIGTNLAKKLCERGDRVVIFSRKANLPQSLTGISGIELISNPLPDPEIISTLDAIVNLTGESIIGERWTEDRKLALKASRVNFTKNLVNNIIKSNIKPKVFISGSAIGYYGMWDAGNPCFDETIGSGSDFLAELSVEWERAALPAKEFTRLVTARIGVVLSLEGGALYQMLAPFKAFIGGPVATGKQYMSWIHIKDINRAFLYLLDNPHLEGPFNLTAPKPISNEVFSDALGKAIGRPSFLRVPSFALHLLYGDGAEVVLKGQNVIPKRLLGEGFQFQFSDIDSALKDIFPSTL